MTQEASPVDPLRKRELNSRTFTQTRTKIPKIENLDDRNFKKLLTGNLNSPVDSNPRFPGKERHLLRA